MSVMSVSEVYSQANSSSSKTDETVMGKDDFLTLLVAQLQHQDPLNPSDSTEFTAQLAQFSSLEQLQNINDELGNFEVYQSTLNNIQSSNFIGKNITATGDSLAVQDGAANPITFSLSRDAANVYVKIYDDAGNFIADFSQGDLPAGQHSLTWNGEYANGQAAENGVYAYEIMATDDNGDFVDATTFVTGTVTGINYETGETRLLIGDQEVSISSIIRVEENNTDNNV